MRLDPARTRDNIPHVPLHKLPQRTRPFDANIEIDRGRFEEWHKGLNLETLPWSQDGKARGRARNFEDFLTQQLRTRYQELEGEFRGVLADDPIHIFLRERSTAEAIFDYLRAAGSALKQSDPDPLAISSTLDQIERQMVRLYSFDTFLTRLVATVARLEDLHPPGWKQYFDQLDTGATDAELRAPLEEAIAACNRQVLATQIANGLQIRRLRTFRTWGFVLLLTLTAATPFLLAPDVWATFYVPKNTGFIESIFRVWYADEQIVFLSPLLYWIPPLSMLLVGLLGGFFSGLQQARTSRVTLADYEEGMLTLSLRPVVGGLAALVLFVLLSWDVVPGIDTTTAGSYLLTGLLAGFSERYFLRILDMSGEAREKNGADPTAPLTTSPGDRQSSRNDVQTRRHDLEPNTLRPDAMPPPRPPAPALESEPVPP